MCPRLRTPLSMTGARADARMLKALAIAKLNYVASVFNVCSELGCRAFASIVEADARPTASGGLRKDYSYLFERFFYFLEDHTEGEQGIVVFDELDKSQSHLLIDQMRRYFAETIVGRRRSNHIIPEPFFVHSDLTTGVQIADLVAYVISWGFRTSRMIKPARAELSQFSAQVANLRYRATRNRMDNPGIWNLEFRAHHRPPYAGRARWCVVRTKKRQMERRSGPQSLHSNNDQLDGNCQVLALVGWRGSCAVGVLECPGSRN